MSTIPLYLRPNYASVAEKLGYDQRELAFLTEFAERGYVTMTLDIPDFGRLSQDIIDRLESYYMADGRIQDAWYTHPPVRELAVNAQVLDALRLLYGREPFPFQTLNFNKGTEQMTHSDVIHFDSSPSGYMAGVWTALEDIDENNGPLHYFPTSHKLPRMTLADVDVPGSAAIPKAYERFYEPMIAKWVEDNELKREEGYLRKGQALIWAANLLHGGSPIKQPGRSRHSQVTHYYFDDCHYFTPLYSDPLLGLTHHREPVDVLTGKPRRGRYAGLPAPAAKAAAPVHAFRWLKRLMLRRRAIATLND